MKKKKLTALLLAFVMVLGLVPAVSAPASAAEADPAYTKAGLEQVRGIEGYNSYQTIYYGDNGNDTPMAWYVLDTAYATGTGNGTLLLTQNVYNGGTQFRAFMTNSNNDTQGGSYGYPVSDVRKYLTGSGTYTTFQTLYNNGKADDIQYGDSSRYFIRRKVDTATADPTKGPYYTMSGATFTAYPASGTGIPALSDTVWVDDYFYINSGSNYTLATSYTAGQTYYYYSGTYNLFTGTAFDANTDYFTFVRGNDSSVSSISSAFGGQGAGRNGWGAVMHYGYSLSPAVTDDYTTGLAESEIVAGKNASEVRTFAVDHKLSQVEQSAAMGVTKGYDASANPKDLQGRDLPTTAYYGGNKRAYYNGVLSGDKYFLLSANEVGKYFYSNGAVIKSDALIGKYFQSSSAAHWWLRSSYDTNNAGNVNTSGVFSNSAATLTALGLRPAFVLNPTSVLFTSAAEGGKSELNGAAGATSGGGEAAADANFENLASSDTTSFKLTLKDTENFAVTGVKVGLGADSTYTAVWESAKLAKDLEHVYVSAIITDKDGENIYGYTKLAQVTEDGSSGSATFRLPEDITELNGDYVLQIFEEQDNGDKRTDYASELTEVEVVSLFQKDTETGVSVEVELSDIERFRAVGSFSASKVEAQEGTGDLIYSIKLLDSSGADLFTAALGGTDGKVELHIPYTGDEADKDKFQVYYFDEDTHEPTTRVPSTFVTDGDEMYFKCYPAHFSLLGLKADREYEIKLEGKNKTADDAGESSDGTAGQRKPSTTMTADLYSKNGDIITVTPKFSGDDQWGADWSITWDPTKLELQDADTIAAKADYNTKKNEDGKVASVIHVANPDDAEPAADFETLSFKVLGTTEETTEIKWEGFVIRNDAAANPHLATATAKTEVNETLTLGIVAEGRAVIEIIKAGVATDEERNKDYVDGYQLVLVYVKDEDGGEPYSGSYVYGDSQMVEIKNSGYAPWEEFIVSYPASVYITGAAEVAKDTFHHVFAWVVKGKADPDQVYASSDAPTVSITHDVQDPAKELKDKDIYNINGDDSANGLDTLAVKRVYNDAGVFTVPDDMATFLRADVNQDKKVDLKDYQQVQKYLLKKL